MAKLTAAARRKLKPSQFALPGGRYPVNDASHARNAKARASGAVNAGRMSRRTEEKIDRKADDVLGKGKEEMRKATASHEQTSDGKGNHVHVHVHHHHHGSEKGKEGEGKKRESHREKHEGSEKKKPEGRMHERKR